MRQLLITISLILFVVAFLPGCSTLMGQGAALDVVGTTPAPVDAGLKCRLLDGNIEAGVANIQGEGFRCSQYGEGTFTGCVVWKEDGMQYWSEGCFKRPKETQEGVTEPAQPDVPEAPVSQ